MSDLNSREWFYVGHYGQLGPLTWEQFQELVRDTVVERDTFVWATGLDNWRPAGELPELQSLFAPANGAGVPPPFNPAGSISSAPPQSAPTNFGQPTYQTQQSNFSQPTQYPVNYPRMQTLSMLPPSDRSRVAAGVLNLFLPGVGRMYLGYIAVGVIQLVLSLLCVIPYVWSFIDGIIILTGGVKIDGYGRRLDG